MIQDASAQPSWVVTPQKVAATIGRIVQFCKPDRVILFGSYPRGHADQDSDLDILVVTQEPVPSPRKESVRIRRHLADITMPMDILVVSKTRLQDLQDIPGLIYQEALRNGKVVYDATEADASGNA